MQKHEFEELYGKGDWHLSDYDYQQVEDFYMTRDDCFDRRDFCDLLNRHAVRFFGLDAPDINPVTVIHEMIRRGL